MEIRKVKKEEYQMLVSFLKKYWKSNHALVKSKQLMDFQHLDGDYYNFYAAVEDGEIYALEGFIKTSLYDKNLIGDSDLWGAIWKSRDDVNKGELGLWVNDSLEDNEVEASLGGIGLSSIAKRINKIKRHTIGYMHQYYIANPTCENFSIGQNLFVNHCSSSKQEWKIKQNILLDEIEEPDVTYRPLKTKEYLRNRYQNHPIYKYIFWGIYNCDKPVSIWVVRRITVGESSVFRVVDMLGRIDDVPSLTANIQEILINESCEYIDLLNYGINKDVLTTIGFTELDFEQNDTIVPSYFEPFEKKNVKIDLSYKAKYEEYVVFKGDADQDRPNIL